MSKRLLAILAIILSLTELPSCSFSGLSAQTLMSPPKANADQQAIYRLLQGTSTDVTFVYPRNGDYRSAIIMRDFTGDGIDDAIGFHSLEDGGVEVQFFIKEGEVEGEPQWRTANAFRNTANQVDRVCFGALHDGGEAVFIGWGSAASTTGRLAAVSAYIYDGEWRMTEYQLGGYGEMVLTDFDQDGVNELFTIDKSVPAEEEGVEPTGAQARLFVFDQNGPYEATASPADNSISSYSAVVFGDLNAKTRGVVVDGATADGSMTTQIFTLEEGKLQNYPTGVNSEGYQNEYARPSSTTFSARDINNDGYIELPAVSRLPGISEDMALDSTSYLVEWRALTAGGGSRLVLRALMNPRENYWFRLPYQLKDRICAINDTERRIVTYTEVTEDAEGNKFLGSTLFTIRVFTRSAWESWGESGGYILLVAQGDSVYCMQMLARNERDRNYVQQVADGFKLLS